MFTKLARLGTISTVKRLRLILAALFCVMAIAIVVVRIPISRGATPASGSVSESNAKVTWTGQIKPASGSSDCGGPNNSGCDNFGVSFQAPASSFGPYLLEIRLQPQGDWDMQVYGPHGNLVDGSGNSPGVVELVTLINPPSGNYVVSAAPFAPLVGTDTNSYAASAELKHYFTNPATQGTDTNISYHNFAAPGSLGNDSGEPTIGVNWKTGRAMMIAGTETLRVTFDDATVPARAIWEDKSFLWTGLITMDPILFTDRSTGRTIVSQLITPAAANSLGVLTDGCSLSAVTDDDGDTWVPDEGCGPPSGADHQSIGGGPFADPLPRELPAPAYAHSVYYCAQSGVTAYCSRSDDGGLTYGPGVPIYTSECSGLHGHPMVGPDGTVYVPNKSCGGNQGVVVSENNGITWSVRPVPDSLQGASDPGVAIGAQGTVYFGYQSGDGVAKVAVSHDKGLTWTESKDVGAAFGIKNSSFPRVVAGDDDRAAFAFLGTPTAGPFQDANFQGEWHLYIAHTFDSGQTWTTIDATPTDPVQRGCIWMQGGSNPCRNLLDFIGEAVDKEGRVLVGYADGCLNCSDPSTSHAKKATIARQVNGRRLFAAYDPVGDPSPTPTPLGSPTPTPTPLPGSNVFHFHGNPTDDTGFTGFGMVDVVAAGGPFLDTRETLGTTVPAHWDVPDPVTSGTADQNIYDPSWIWSLNSPTTLNGPMTMKWWASCSGCSAAAHLNVDWTIRLWADGIKVFEQTVTNVTPDLPNVPQLLQTTVAVPTVTASTRFVLHIDPVFVDGQVNTHIYYDSQSACPGATGNEPCDSTVTMPIIGANPTPTPIPTPNGSPTPTPTPTATPTPTPGPAPPAASFGHNTLADFSAVGGEPFIRVDKQDHIFVSSPFGFSTTVSLLWKSTDHGRTFIPLGTPIVRDAVTGPGGGDTHMDFDDRNRLYYVDLSAACTTAAVSEDGGNTFPLDRNNPLTCIGGGDDPEGATDDRQWVAAFGDGVAYSTVRNLAVAVGSGNFHMSKTTDAGKTWTAQIIGNVGQSGPLEVDKTKRRINLNGTQKDAILLYQIYFTGSTLKLIRIADLNDGSPYIINDLTIPTPGSISVSTVFPVLSIDKAGNLYAGWSDGSKIKMAASTDRGEHWTAPAQVNPTSMTGMNIMPWIVAGDPGRVDVIWYHTEGGNNESARWDVQMAQTLDALSGNPTFTTNKVNENTIHTGEICLEGLNCDIDTLAGTPRDRSFAEFPSVDIDSRGAAYITYNDSTNQLPAPYVMVARQTGGASLFASAGSITDSVGTVTISQPSAGNTIRTASMTLSGTHTLTPKNFDRDENTDATFPDHGAVIGSNIPALDLKSVSLSDDSASVTVTMQVADLSTTALATAPAQSGGDGVLYLTQMHSANRVYWVGAEFRAGQARYLTGDLGSINSSTAKKYITYNPDAINSLSVQGSVTNTAPGTITMKIPRTLLGNPVNGAVFTSVTGYAFSEHGPLAPAAGGTPNVTSLPVQVDTAGALTYIIGDGGPKLDGVVEVSIDDPSFTSPRVASLGEAVSGNTWSLQLGGADLVVGAHTAYVRQRINGRAPSPTTSVAFTVAATVEQSVTSLVSLTTSNARSSLGVSSYDMTIKNTSSMTIFAPIRIEVASITSVSGRVTVSNADNGTTGAGAAWDYSTKLGTDNALTANEVSAARNLRFDNPNNEAFTVTFNVIGNVDRSVAGGSSSSISGGGGTTGGATASSGTSSTSTITTVLYSLTYNPLLNTVALKLIGP